MKELEPLISQLVDVIKGTKEFVVSEAPDFIRQFVIFSYVNTIGWLVFSIIAFGVVLKFALWLRKNWREVDDPINFLGTLGILIAGTGSIFGIICNVTDLFWIWLAPKVYIVMHIASCLGGSPK